MIESACGIDYRKMFDHAFALTLYSDRVAKLRPELSDIAKNLEATKGFAKSKTIKNLRERLEKVVEEL